MLVKETFFVVLLCISLQNIQATSKDVSPAAEGGNYTWEEAYYQIPKIGPQQCSRQCKKNAICKFVGYDRVRYVCHLFNRNINTTSFEQDGDYILIYNTIQMEKTIKGPCSNNNCPKGTRCEELTTSSSAVCFKTGCQHMQYSFDLNTRTCYRVVVSESLSWISAGRFCKNDGGDMISLNTNAKNRFIANILQSYTDARYWFGLNDIKEEGQFVWSNREDQSLPVENFTSWSDNQPNNIDFNFAKNADCCVIQSNGLWWDDGCEDLNPFICEITL